MCRYFDAHTHKKTATDAIVNIRVGVDSLTLDINCFSAGIHPYDAAKATGRHFDELELLASHPSCVAIGECGVDHRYENIPLQVEVLSRQIEIAAQAQKPLIIHCVRAENEILKATAHFSGKIVFHAYASYSAQTAVRQNILFSVDPRAITNPKLLQIPQGRLLAESDESETPINEIYDMISQKIGRDMCDILNNNFHNTFDF